MDRFDGLADFIVARQAALSRVAFLLTGDHDAARDLLQSALEKTARHWRRVSRSENPEAYVRRMLYNTFISSWRRQRRRIAEYPTAVPPDLPSIHDESERAARRLTLERALVRLTPKQRAVIVLRFHEDLSEVDTVQAMGCSLGTVKSQTHYALGRLRALAPELATVMEVSV